MRNDSGRALEWRYGSAVQQRTCGTTEEVVPFHRREPVNVSFDALDDINDGLQRGLMSIVAPQNDGQDGSIHYVASFISGRRSLYLLSPSWASSKTHKKGGRITNCAEYFFFFAISG